MRRVGPGEGRDRDRLRALTRAAYTAAAGHLEVDPEDPDPRVRRWWPSARAAVVAGAAVLVVALVLGLRAWAGASTEAV
ncbi:hypothetical protein PU560_12550, partial [Georgenia sp. 10Sc9-8]|nr:hypothetical protein [Georgenia halotolerans]